MTQEDPSDRFIAESLRLINETKERAYYHGENEKLLVASWKPGSPDTYDMHAFQTNAMHFAKLIEERKPRQVMVDCRHMGFEVTYQDHLWYINQTRQLWAKSTIKRMAFVFKSNLAVQMAMEELKEVAEDEGIRQFEYRIFEDVAEAAGWLKADS